MSYIGIPSRARSATAARSAPPEPPKKKKGPGLLGLGFGPNIGLGGITALKELGAGGTGLLRLATSPLPGGTPFGGAFSAAGKGLTSSLLGTLATIQKYPALGYGDRPVEYLGEKLLGKEYRPKDLSEKIRERGIIPGLVEDIGNVALVGAAYTAPAKIGARLAARSGNVARAAELTAKGERLGAIKQPYRTAFQKVVRPGLKGAQARVMEAAGAQPMHLPPTAVEAARAADRAETMAGRAEKRATTLRRGAEAGSFHERLEEAAVRAQEMAEQRRAAAQQTAKEAGEAWDQPTTPPEAATPPGPGPTLQATKFRERIRELAQGVRSTGDLPGIGRGTRMAAGAAGWLDTSDLLKQAHTQRRMAEAARRGVNRSPAVKAAKAAAEDFLVSRGEHPVRASEIVGDEIRARLSGVHQLAEDLGGGPIHELLSRDKLRKHLAPADLAGNPEWEAALNTATEAMRAEHANAMETLTSGRKEFEGLERAGVDDLDLLPEHERQLALAAKERLQAATLQNKIQTQRLVQGRRIAGAEDNVARLGDRLQRLDQAREGTLAAFDDTRQYVPPALAASQRANTYAAIVQRVQEAWEASGRTGGGLTFNPHTGALFDPHTAGGRFIEAGEDGYAVGVVNDTAVKTAVDQLTPDHVDRLVRAYQNLFENKEIMLGAWVDGEGNVHLDPSQVVKNRDRAITLAAARSQEKLWDNGAMSEIKPYLSHRADVAARFVGEDTFRGHRARELRQAAQSKFHNLDDAEIDRWMALDDLIATSAYEKGLYSHPDGWYRAKRYEIKKGRRFLRKGTVEQMLTQTHLKRDYDERLWDDVTKYLGPEQLERAMKWYERSHEWVKEKFAGKTIKLADGSVRPADEVFFQLLAVTSVQASPTTNLGNALKATANINRFMELPEFEKIRNHYAEVLTKASDEGWTRTETMEHLFPKEMTEQNSLARKKAILTSKLGEPLTGSKRGSEAAQKARERGRVYKGMAGLNAHMYDFSKTLVHEILSGNTMDKWTAEGINDMTRAWTGKEKLTQPMREMIKSFDGNEQAAMEHFGGELWAKLRSFHSNLSDPHNSQLATLDSWMARLMDLENWESPGTYATYAQKVRDMASYASEQMGRKVMPHEVQAALWAYSKLQIGRQNWGRLMGFAGDTLKQLDDGTWSAANDATSPYFMEDIAGSEAARGRMAGFEEGAEPAAEAGEAAPTKGFRIDERQIRRPYLEGEGGQRLDVRPMAWPRTRDEINALKDTLMEEEGIEAPRAGARISDATAKSIIDRRFRADLARAEVGTETQYKAHPTQLEGEMVAPDGSVKRVLKSEEQMAGYGKTQEAMQAALAAGDVDGARGTYMKWINSQRKTLLDEEWGDFNDIAGKTGAADLQGALEAVRQQGFPQKFDRQILGTMSPKESQYLIRLYRDADFTTLVHENAHVLRQILPDHQIDLIQRAYGVGNGQWTNQHEERFADDFVNFLASDGKVGGLVRHPELGDVFSTVRQHLATYWNDAARHMDDVPPEAARLFDRWLSPQKGARPEGVIGVDLPTRPEMSGQKLATRQQLAGRPPDIPLGTPQAAFRRGASGQRALRDLDKVEARYSQIDAAKVTAEQHLAEMRRVLNEAQLPAEVRQAGLRESAQARLEQIDRGLDTPGASQVPRAWQPIWEAVEHLNKQVKEMPELAQVFEGGNLPQTFSEVLRLAADKGFRPEHIRDFTPAQVQRLVFENMRLGRPHMGDVGEEVTAGTRRRSTGQLRKTGEVDTSLESFMAGSVEAITEKHTNALVDWVEKNLARRIPETGTIPQGWSTWDPQRHLLLTGKELPSGATQAERGAQFMVPTPAAKQLRRMTNDFSHPALTGLAKTLKPWRAWILSMNPRYYINNVVGGLVLGTAEGAGLGDWKAAWDEYRRGAPQGRTRLGRRFGPGTEAFGGVPVGGEGQAMAYGLGRDEATVVRPQRRSAREAAAHPVESYRRGIDRANRVNETADAFARTAVYKSMKRKAGFTEEQALNKAYEALVDYNSLSPFERQAVRTVVPFYAWQKGILKIAMKQPFDHPARTALLMALSQFNDDAAADWMGVQDPSQVPQDYRHLIGRFSVKAMNPFADAHVLVDPSEIDQIMNPLLESVIRKGVGAPESGYASEQRLGNYGSVEDDTNLTGDLASQFLGGPTAAIAQLAGMESLGGRPVGETSAMRWAGLPMVGEGQLGRARERIRKSSRRIQGLPAESEKKKDEAPAKRRYVGVG